MLRKLTSITLVLSLIALGSSGILMLFLNSLTFQLQMHPVHKIFGIIMVLAGCVHMYLNFNPIKKYLKERNVLFPGALLSIVLLFLFVVGMNKPLDTAQIKEIEQMMSQLAVKK